MKTLIHALFHSIASTLCERWHLSLELLALRHQVEVLKRSAQRPRFSSADRCVWLIVSCLWSRRPHALDIIQADTVRWWRRQGMRHHVRWRRGRKRPGRPALPTETRHLIREMSRDNILWGAPRIHGELRKLGITVSRTTVATSMDRRPGPPSPTWRTFWRTHAPDLLVSEVYAELSGRLRAVYTRGILPLRHGLCRFVSGWRRRVVCRHVMLTTSATDPHFAPVARPLRLIEVVRAFGRSPPDCPSSSIHPLSPSNLPIERGRIDVRLDASMMTGWAVSPHLPLTWQPVIKVQRTDVSQQAAA